MKKKTLAAFFLYSLLVPGSAWAALDPNAPELLSIAISPNPVDVSSGQETITVTVRITDNEDGFSNGNLDIYNPDGNFVRTGFFAASSRISGTAADGIYQVGVEIPGHVIPGTWRVDATLRDGTSHVQNYGPDNQEFPVPAARYFQVVNNGTVDADEPALLDCALSPSAPPGGTVKMDLHVSDPVSGFSYGFPYFYGPGGVYIPEMTLQFDEFERTSGDENDGNYHLEVAVPEDAPTGPYSLLFYFVDQAGNSGFANAGNLTVSAGGTQPYSLGNATDAVHLPWTSSAPAWIYQTDVSHDGADAARSGPTTHNGESVMETFLPNAGTLSFWWRTDSEAGLDWLSLDVLGTGQHLAISGDSGWTQQTVTIPAGGRTVRWTYKKSTSGSAGQDCGWVDEIRFIADEDAELPSLQNLIISPRLADISAGSQQMTFKIVATDDNKGVAGGNLRVYDPFSNEFLSFSFDEGSRTSGDAQQGTYTLNAMIPFGVSPGIWRVEVDLIEADTAAFNNYGPRANSFPNPGEESFQVSDGSVGDTNAPAIISSALNPSVVDITAGAGNITLTLEITDEGSGFRQGNIGVYTSGPDNWTGATFFDSGSRISGDELDGIYQITLPVAAFGPAGTWRIGASLVDWDGNQRDYAPTVDLPGDESFTVINDGQQDTTKPIVESIDITPVGVDITNGPAQITITATIKDELSGIRDAILFFYNPNGLLVDSFTKSLDASNRVSGDDHTGTYQLTVIIPQGAVTGQWEVTTFLRDHVGETRSHGSGADAYPQVGDGKFSVGTGGGGGGSTYANFINLYHLSGDQALPAADPDGDGLNNATELMLGTDPTSSAGNARNLITVTRDATHLHLFFTIDPSLDVDEDGNYLKIGGGSLPLRMTGQTASSPNGPWTEVLPVQINGSTYRISRAINSSSKGCLRLYFPD
ncbi:hypothetical protein [Haloferula sp. BvORR071]|uniref:DUF7035 domain-containing protein n=1 Tax=Haloferula sp. BvORR071 TaxID=1396141 RepID=UPI00054F69A8|nr:hypothetical protein [Haloferula sp. BvORR071]